MARPFCCRRIRFAPRIVYYKPRGIPLTSLQEIVLTLDELEAIRLADYEGMYQEEAAQRMNISRPTFGRIIESAHKKIAEAIIQGKALKIEGGNVKMSTIRVFRCSDCQHTWTVPYGTPRPSQCPTCSSHNLHRAAEDRGHGHRGGPCRGRFKQMNTPFKNVDEIKGDEK